MLALHADHRPQECSGPPPALQAVHEVIEMSDNQRRAVMAALEAGAGRSAADLWTPDAAQGDPPPWVPPAPARGQSLGGSRLAPELQRPLLSSPVPRCLPSLSAHRALHDGPLAPRALLQADHARTQSLVCVVQPAARLVAVVDLPVLVLPCAPLLEEALSEAVFRSGFRV